MASLISRNGETSVGEIILYVVIAAHASAFV